MRILPRPITEEGLDGLISGIKMRDDTDNQLKSNRSEYARKIIDDKIRALMVQNVKLARDDFQQFITIYEDKRKRGLVVRRDKLITDFLDGLRISDEGIQDKSTLHKFTNDEDVRIAFAKKIDNYLIINDDIECKTAIEQLLILQKYVCFLCNPIAILFGDIQAIRNTNLSDIALALLDPLHKSLFI